jgi:hypothetical protein
MSRVHPALLGLIALALALPLPGCSGQPAQSPEIAEQAPPPPPGAPAPPAAGRMDQREEPAPPPPAPRTRPRRTSEGIPEERPQTPIPLPRAPQPPPAPATVSLSIPQGTELSLALAQEVSSASAVVGDPVSAELKAPVIVGDRVIFPAGSRVEGKVIDVKPAKKGFKETGGAIALSFNRIVAPDGHAAAISAGLSKIAEGSAKKKGAIIGGSAVGGALLGRVLGKDAKGAAIIGGAIGTAVAGSTKGREAVLGPEDEISVSLERSATTTMKR